MLGEEASGQNDEEVIEFDDASASENFDRIDFNNNLAQETANLISSINQENQHMEENVKENARQHIKDYLKKMKEALDDTDRRYLENRQKLISFELYRKDTLSGRSKTHLSLKQLYNEIKVLCPDENIAGQAMPNESQNQSQVLTKEENDQLQVIVQRDLVQVNLEADSAQDQRQFLQSNIQSQFYHQAQGQAQPYNRTRRRGEPPFEGRNFPLYNVSGQGQDQSLPNYRCQGQFPTHIQPNYFLQSRGQNQMQNFNQTLRQPYYPQQFYSPQQIVNQVQGHPHLLGQVTAQFPNQTYNPGPQQVQAVYPNVGQGYPQYYNPGQLEPSHYSSVHVQMPTQTYNMNMGQRIRQPYNQGNTSSMQYYTSSVVRSQGQEGRGQVQNHAYASSRRSPRDVRRY